ncbi:MAG: Microsomal dipeptidase [Brockia lithotrophica]|uniref:Microsomal dipeptidase n=1 Tax=Brockia lithotrophica TaxID=933949 RepID=A0A2T5G8L7_9BACL|nr:membrane dipeptidase [Brockia lithotrophica]PTQ52542.1 MAG: Microsomal dipeptidase [Brockia lithotrophica]
MPIADAHADVLYRLWRLRRHRLLREEDGEVRWEDEELHVTPARLRDGDVRLLFTPIYLPPFAVAEGGFAAALEQVDLFYRTVLGDPPEDGRRDAPSAGDRVSRSEKTGEAWPRVLLRSPSDLARVKREGGTVFLLALEGLDAVGGNLTYLRTLLRLGVRSVGLTHNPANLAADGAGEPRGGGLTRFGAAALEELIRFGVLVDVAHLSERGFWDVVRFLEERGARVPLVATHANVWTLRPHPRNLRDEQLLALKRLGGGVGITFVPAFLADGPEADLTDVLRHVEYALALLGDAHVFFGSDFDGIERTPRGLEHAGRWGRLLEELHRRYPQETVERIAWGNLSRIVEAALAGGEEISRGR